MGGGNPFSTDTFRPVSKKRFLLEQKNKIKLLINKKKCCINLLLVLVLVLSFCVHVLYTFTTPFFVVVIHILLAPHIIIFLLLFIIDESLC